MQNKVNNLQDQAIAQPGVEKKNYTGYLLAVFLIILFFGIGILVGKNYFINPTVETRDLRVSPTNAVSPSAVPTADPTAASNAAMANWKVYKNEKWGFEFKYPQSLKYTENNRKDYLVDFSLSSENFSTTSNKLDTIVNTGYEVNIGMFEQVNKVCSDMEKSGEAKRHKGYEKIKFDNFDAQRTENQIYINYQEECLTVSIGSEQAKKVQNLQIFSQILSTFKFTEKEDETLNWKTYKNIKIGYQLKYPTDWTLKETENENSMFFGKPIKYITITTPDEKYFLHLGFKKKNDVFLITDRTGVGANDVQQSKESIKIINTTLVPQLMLYNNKIKEVFYPQPEDDKERSNYEFMISFSCSNMLENCDMADLPYLNQVRQILESVAMIN